MNTIGTCKIDGHNWHSEQPSGKNFRSYDPGEPKNLFYFYAKIYTYNIYFFVQI